MRTRYLTAVLLCVPAALSGQRTVGDEPKTSGPTVLTAEQTAKLKERDGAAQEAARLRDQSKYGEALAPAGKAVALTREVRGEGHPEVAEALGRLAEGQELTGDFAAAVKSRRQVLALRTKVDGEKHWRTADAKLALAFAEKVAGLAKDEQAKLTDALRGEQQAVRLNGRGKFAEAERAALAVLEVYQATLGAERAEVGRVWHLVGCTRLGRRDAKGAKEANERALAIYRKVLPGAHPDLGRSLNNLGVALQELNDLVAARKCVEEAVSVWKESLGRDSLLIAGGLYNLGSLQCDLHDYPAALQSHAGALAIRRQTLPNGHPDIARSLYKMGIVQFYLRDYPAALQSQAEALAIRRQALPRDHPDIVKSLNNLGVVQDASGNYPAALRSHAEALAIQRQALPKRHPDIATTLNSLGNVQRKLRDYPAALKTHAEALAIRRQVLPKDHPKIAESLNSLGVMHGELGDYAAATKNLQQAVAIYRGALPRDHPEIAQTLTNLGGAQLELGNYAGARKSLDEALAIYRRAWPQDPSLVATSLNNLGNLQDELRDYPAALQSHAEALAIRRQVLPKDHPDIAQSLTNLGIVLEKLRDHAAALKSHEAALAIYRRALPKDHPLIAISLNNLGCAQGGLRDYVAAKKSLEEALAVRRKALPKDHPGIATTLNSLGIVQRELGDYAAAVRSHAEALTICRQALPKDHPNTAGTLHNLACLALSSPKATGLAREQLGEAIRIKQRYLSRLALAQAENEQLRAAAESRASLDLLLSLPAGVKPEPNAEVYSLVVGIKGAVTSRQRWARQLRDTTDPEARDLLQQLLQLNRHLLNSAVDRAPGRRHDIWQAVERRAQLERQLAERSPAFRERLEQDYRGASELRTALPTGTVLLDFLAYWHYSAPPQGGFNVSAERRLVVFVVRPDQPDLVLVPLGAIAPVEELIQAWRDSHGRGKASPADRPDPARQLRQKLWQPLQQHLGPARVVLVSPDGPLHGLPFGALPGAKEGTFLIHEYAFATVPVPQLLPELLRGTPRPAKDKPTALLAGGIDFGEGRGRDSHAPAGKLPPVPLFRPLRGSESEVNDLRTQFEDTFPEAAAPKLLRKEKASKQAFLAAAPTHRFVHLATHGFFAAESEKSALAPESPSELLRGELRLRPEVTGWHPGLLSGVVFAGVNRPDTPPEDTILTALEVGELGLDQVELLVLSACETGRGQVAGGEGVLGLQRAFQVAGAHSVVASLWGVPDEETHQLMREFYRRVWSDKPVSKAEALRQAQLWMLENWKPRGGLERPAPKGPPPPYVWAAFVLSGDWR